jgi:hypothetical protein
MAQLFFAEDLVHPNNDSAQRRDAMGPESSSAFLEDKADILRSKPWIFGRPHIAWVHQLLRIE